tara:strand:- start:829 stop:1080 length:252 start_codon:yes stop_codon:yes gene_type:complete
MDYTITLTDTEQKCLEYIAVDVDDWITNAAQNRARQAKEQILAVNSAHCNANGIAIAVGEDAQVTQAYSLGVVAKATSEYKTE